jgi:hypothetical protein
VLALLIGLAAPDAEAVPILADATFKEFVGCGVDVPSIPQNLECDESIVENGFTYQFVGRASTIAGMQPMVDISLDLGSTYETQFIHSASAEIRYQFAVIANSPTASDDVLVPLNVSSHGQISGSHGVGSIIVYVGSSAFGDLNNIGAAGGFFASFNTSGQILVRPGQVEGVIMTANGTVSTTDAINTHANIEVVADPLIVIDPNFALRDLYSLIFSANLCPTIDCGTEGAVGVPEPSTLVLFGFGLLGLGMMCRRRRLKA